MTAPKYNPSNKPQAGVKRATRTCLFRVQSTGEICGREFASEGRGIRKCPRCRKLKTEVSKIEQAQVNNGGGGVHWMSRGSQANKSAE
jgi:hypothetical protein